MAFIIGCAVCASLFVGIMQLKPGKTQGILLLLPSVGLIAVAVGFLLRPEIDIQIYIAYGLIGLSAAFALWIVYEIIARRKDKSTTAYFGRLIKFAAMSAPLSLIVGIILTIAEVDDMNVLVCLSTAVFGGFALIVALNLILVSLCGFQSTMQSLKTANEPFKSKRLVFVRISLAKDVFMVLAKTAISVVAASFFMFANALYSAGLGVARFIAVKMHTQDRETQIKSYSKVGVVIFLASVSYVVYSVRWFWKSEMPTYDMIVGIAIACYTFFEFGLNIREAWRQRKSHALEAKALRAIGLSSTLLCFVLTQTALMSFANEGDSSLANALAGVVFGGSASLVGVYVMVRSRILRGHTHV